MCGIPEANVDRVLAAYGARLQEGVPALEQQHQRPHRDQEEVVQLGDLRHLQVIKLAANKSNFMLSSTLPVWYIWVACLIRHTCTVYLPARQFVSVHELFV